MRSSSETQMAQNSYSSSRNLYALVQALRNFRQHSTMDTFRLRDLWSIIRLKIPPTLKVSKQRSSANSTSTELNQAPLSPGGPGGRASPGGGLGVRPPNSEKRATHVCAFRKHKSPAPRRGGGIRTHDLLDPNEARYQAAPHPDVNHLLWVVVESNGWRRVLSSGSQLHGYL